MKKSNKAMVITLSHLQKGKTISLVFIEEGRTLIEFDNGEFLYIQGSNLTTRWGDPDGNRISVENEWSLDLKKNWDQQTRDLTAELENDRLEGYIYND